MNDPDVTTDPCSLHQYKIPILCMPSFLPFHFFFPYNWYRLLVSVTYTVVDYNKRQKDSIKLFMYVCIFVFITVVEQNISFILVLLDREIMAIWLIDFQAILFVREK